MVKLESRFLLKQKLLRTRGHSVQRYKLGGFISRLHVRVLSVASIDGESGRFRARAEFGEI